MSAIKYPSRLELTRRLMSRTAALHAGYNGNNDDPAAQAEFGRTIIEYLHEAAHGGWEGFSGSDVSSIHRLLADIELFIEAKESLS